MPRYTLIFDHDGTILDNGLVEGVVASRAFEKLGIHITPEDYAVRFSSITNTAAYKALTDEARISLPEGFEKETEKEIIRATLAQGPGIVMPGMSQMLHSLAGENFHLGIGSSSGFEWLNSMLGQTHLADLFGKDVYSARQVPHGKPAPDLPLFAAKMMGAAPENCIYIGDGLSDVIAGKTAGMRAIGLISGSHCAHNPALREKMLTAGADYVAGSVQDLHAAILRMESPALQSKLRGPLRAKCG